MFIILSLFVVCRNWVTRSISRMTNTTQSTTTRLSWVKTRHETSRNWAQRRVRSDSGEYCEGGGRDYWDGLGRKRRQILRRAESRGESGASRVSVGRVEGGTTGRIKAGRGGTRLRGTESRGESGASRVSTVRVEGGTTGRVKTEEARGFEELSPEESQERLGWVLWGWTEGLLGRGGRRRETSKSWAQRRVRSVSGECREGGGRNYWEGQDRERRCETWKRWAQRRVRSVSGECREGRGRDYWEGQDRGRRCETWKRWAQRRVRSVLGEYCEGGGRDYWAGGEGGERLRGAEPRGESRATRVSTVKVEGGYLEDWSGALVRWRLRTGKEPFQKTCVHFLQASIVFPEDHLAVTRSHYKWCPGDLSWEEWPPFIVCLFLDCPKYYIKFNVWTT